MWPASVVVLAAAIAPFLSTVDDYFIGDDFGLVQHFSSKPPLHFLSLFTSSWTERIYGGPYDELRPFVALSYQVDSLWGPASPVGYHLDNLLFHALNALLVLGLARVAAGLSPLWATCAAVLFGVLPVHAEPVAWISGRADLIPAFFSLGSVLGYATWRRAGDGWAYAASVALCFGALFSKQSGIMLLPALVLYDLLLARERRRTSRRALLAYVPFLALTVGYLGLRSLLFSQAVREDQLGAAALADLARRLPDYLVALVVSPQPLHTDRFSLLRGLVGIVLALLPLHAATVYGQLQKAPPAQARRVVRSLLYFGPVWLLLSIVPLIVVTYYTARHLYLASAGYVIVLAVLLEVLWTARRWSTAVAGLVLVVAYAYALRPAVGDWSRAAAISEKLTRVVQAEAASAADGTLLLVDAPHVSPRTDTWVWSFALPFALQPPFSETDPYARIAVVENLSLYCCPPQEWLVHVRGDVQRWSQRPSPAPVVVLRWDESAGEMARRSDAEAPELRSAVARLAEAHSPDELQARLAAVVQDVRVQD